MIMTQAYLSLAGDLQKVSFIKSNLTFLYIHVIKYLTKDYLLWDSKACLSWVSCFGFANILHNYICSKYSILNVRRNMRLEKYFSFGSLILNVSINGQSIIWNSLSI